MDVQAIDQSHAAVKAKPAGEALPAFELPAFGKGFASGVKPDETLSQALSTLAGGGANVSVSFQVLEHPDQIVTVFKNADTGEVITQFPAQTMVVLAQFFNKLAGAVLDRTV
jgi:FlaG protein